MHANSKDKQSLVDCSISVISSIPYTCQYYLYVVVI